MDFSKFERLPMIDVGFKCPEDWDAMEGDEQLRHCAGCGCQVHNIAELSAEEAEALAIRNETERVCIRLTFSKKLGILTKDGWVPRLAAAGIIAATAAGCATSPTTAASASAPPPAFGGKTPGEAFDDMKDKASEVAESVKEKFLPGSKKEPEVYAISGWVSLVSTKSGAGGEPIHEAKYVPESAKN
ncbi:MAG: hypothetical protein GC165_18175 [Armatimonadetes bacterium]|nr:hypothetical protein [Armatimonadota bacterium]